MLTEVPPRRSRLGLPDFPWDTIAAARATAEAHADGIVDLSIGTPIDPTPERARLALSRAVDANDRALEAARMMTPWYEIARVPYGRHLRRT